MPEANITDQIWEAIREWQNQQPDPDQYPLVKVDAELEEQVKSECEPGTHFIPGMRGQPEKIWGAPIEFVSHPEQPIEATSQ